MDKKFLRIKLIEKRRAISSPRREEARSLLIHALAPLLGRYRSVLSFVNLPEEIDISLINEELLKSKKLILPKIQGNELIPTAFESFNPTFSPLNLPPGNRVDYAAIECVLVPALGFDEQRMRIGFGKGYYDRLLKKLPQAFKIGIGFKEQKTDFPLPSEEHDQRVDLLLLT
jgi:5-formyltetrahydrofolate cyclo-ligase